MGFQAHYNLAGSRGLASLIDRDRQGELIFILQIRCVDKGEVFAYTEIPVMLVEDHRIQFCPWCGVNLGSFYKNIDEKFLRPGFRTLIKGLDDI